MRSTLIVHSRLSWLLVRARAAAERRHGLQALSIEQVAARLAGGFSRPIEDETLKDAIRSSLTADLGELNEIKGFPGFVRAAAASLDKVWAAGIDLVARAANETGAAQSRLAALAQLEAEVLRHLPAGMLRPGDLVAAALKRAKFAKAILGPVSVEGRTEMSPVWRPILEALVDETGVTWNAGPRSVPSWVRHLKVSVAETKALTPEIRAVSCASPRHEALEAMRWTRVLMASGRAKPADIAIVAAATDEWDDHIHALSEAVGIDLHFVSGRRALAMPEGQLAAALAEILLRGFGQSRMTRLVSLLRSQSRKFEAIPNFWWRSLPENAPLLTAADWHMALDSLGNADFENAKAVAGIVATLADDLSAGLKRAGEIGEKLLTSRALAIWRNALIEGPPEALDVTLAGLRVPDQVAPEANIIWAPAGAVAAAPRPFVWLIGLSSRAWPRHQAEDPLLPNHIVPNSELEPLPVHEADRRDFETVLRTTAEELICSRARRDAQGRLNGRSPLFPADAETRYLQRARIPEHAASEADRLFARPEEFARTAAAEAARTCWIDWHSDRLTSHDGLMREGHPMLLRSLDRPQSATSLVKLLRDPIAYLWTYGFRWNEPEQSEEPLTLDPLAFGNLLHAVLEEAVNRLEGADGFAAAAADAIGAAVQSAVKKVAAVWERENPVPPPVIWQRKLAQIHALATAALTFPEPALIGQRSWAEVPFGGFESGVVLAEEARGKLPWDPTQMVIIPGVELAIAGVIDRLDLSGDGIKARVTDYKSGKLRSKSLVLNGGAELQRCLYAFAVMSLVGSKVEIDTRLLFPRAGEKGLVVLLEPGAVLEKLSRYLKAARDHFLAGNVLPGAGAQDDYNDYAFALPGGAKERYFAIKTPLITKRLSDLVPLWEHD